MRNYILNFFSRIFLLGASMFCVFPVASWAQPVFTDVTDAAGINHSFEIFQGIFGGGAAVIDFDKDGWEDVFIAGGAGEDQLLRNLGNGTFENVSLKAGFDVLEDFVTQGAAVADVNKDGWPDLFLTTITYVSGNTFGEAPNVLLINDKDGTFSDQSLAYGIVEGTFSSGASFGDVNRDGYPDIYVSNYFENFEGSLDEFEGPLVNGNTSPAKDLLYINVNGERFVESSASYGIERRGLTFQGLWTDIDNDNDLDILVANDFGNRETPNLVYRNEFPVMAFTEIGADKKFDYGINGMGLGACDINMDGFMDYLVSNIQVSPFFVNQGPDAPFVEQSALRRAAFATVSTDAGNRVVPVSWGVNFFDVDNDMDSDLYLSNGCLNPSLTPNPNLLLENTEGRFSEYGSVTNTNDHSISRGSIVFDYDHDGDMDLLVVNQKPYQDENIGVELKGTRLFRNDNSNQNNWLKIKLEGNKSESSGIGSRVEVYVGENMLVKEVYGGSSHESQNSSLLHFGLGAFTSADSVIIKWSGSGKQILTEVAAGQVLAVVEDAIFVGGDISGLKIYPVPFTDHILLDVPGNLFQESGLVRILDSRGNEIYRRLFPSLDFLGNKVDIKHNLSAGVYIVLIETVKGNFQEKILKL